MWGNVATQRRNISPRTSLQKPNKSVLNWPCKQPISMLQTMGVLPKPCINHLTHIEKQTSFVGILYCCHSRVMGFLHGSVISILSPCHYGVMGFLRRLAALILIFLYRLRATVSSLSTLLRDIIVEINIWLDCQTNTRALSNLYLMKVSINEIPVTASLSHHASVFSLLSLNNSMWKIIL